MFSADFRRVDGSFKVRVAEVDVNVIVTTEMTSMILETLMTDKSNLPLDFIQGVSLTVKSCMQVSLILEPTGRDPRPSFCRT